jgi:hypothetical protein
VALGEDVNHGNIDSSSTRPIKLSLGHHPIDFVLFFLIISLVGMAAMVTWHSLKQAQGFRLPRIQMQLETNFANT